MKKKIEYTDGPIGKFRIIEDFLPPPEVLALAPVRIKITITLDGSTLDYFKKAADKYHGSYQQMIRRLLTAYAVRHPLA